jgi:hypothetical protein
MRRVLAAAVFAGALLLGASPAAPPDHPVSFIGADDLHRRLEAGETPEIVDVRSTEEFDELHIKDARSIPLRAVRARAVELPRRGLVVLY